MKRFEKKVVRQPRGPMIMSALGQFKADLVLKNANVLNVFTKEFMPRDVAVNGDTIIGIGRVSGRFGIRLFRQVYRSGIY